MTNTTIIETERLILRTWKKEDAESYFAVQSRPENNKFFSNFLSLQQTKNFILHLNKHFEEFRYTLWAAELKINNELIGYIGFSNTDFHPLKYAIDIGFLINEKYQNIGLATEGAKACLEYGYKILRLKEIIAYTPSINLSSIKVLEKIGLKRDLHGDFAHPKLELDHKLSHHILYRNTLS